MGRSEARLPPIPNLPEALVVGRSDVTAYCLNPFSFHINHDPGQMRILDAKVQEFGERFTDLDSVDEPMDWGMVKLDNRWHRIHVLEKYFTSNLECCGAEVCLIDTGRRERLDIKQIFPMPPEVLTAAPAQSLRIFPKNIQRPTAATICELFEYYPEARFRLTFDELSMSGKKNPHSAGTVAEVEVGHEEWISLRQLLLSPFVDDGESNNNAIRTTSEVRPNDDAYADSAALNLSIPKPNGRPPVTAPRNGTCELREDNRESDAFSSDDEPSTELPDTEVEEKITFERRATGVPVDLEGENQGIFMTKKTLENARKAERRNIFRTRLCEKFRSPNGCPNGDFCPHPHVYLEESAQAATGTLVEFRDYPDLLVSNGFTAFGVCTHVDETGLIYLVLPYGATDVWTVLELKENLDLEFRDISEELRRLYDHQRGKKRNPFNPSDNLAVVWMDERGFPFVYRNHGELHNITPGWYRARIREREGKRFKVFLVDHGAIHTTSIENLYPLENELCNRKVQAIRCRISGTALSTGPGSVSKIYEGLKKRLLIFKVYKHDEEVNVYQVHMISFSETKVTHLGEDFTDKGILSPTDS